MPGPFPDTTVEAVGVCLRTLAQQPDADAALATSTAATLSGLRAYADRVALRRRFHDADVHAEHRPGEPHAAALYDLLEHARLDAIGARWLAGMARNLTAHPGLDDDGLRWLAFSTLSGQATPPEKAAHAAAVARRLPAALAARLDDLVRCRENAPAFAAAAGRWARDAAAYVPPPPAPSDGSAHVPLPRREIRLRQLPKRGDPGGTKAPLRQDRREGDTSGEASSGAQIDSTGTVHSYHAYTTAHDRVVNALTLATRSELVELHSRLENELSAARTVVARLAKRLMRVLMARQTREWSFDLDEGLLDGSRLARLVASGGRARPFKQESDSPFPSTVVSLLIDHSGSMRGRPMLIAALTVEIFARVLERCGVRCEVLGFTTREWDGGEPAREWAANGYRENPGRLNALEHIVIKNADVPWRRARQGLGLFLHEEILKENIDGEAVAWAHGRLLARGEARRILVVVSDGTPMDEATLAANGYEYLDQHLKTVVEGIERSSPVKLAAIGIGHDVSTIYANATTIARIDHLGPALTEKLIALLGDSTTTAPRQRRRATAR
jgi:cobaltochelatase CobT